MSLHVSWPKGPVMRFQMIASQPLYSLSWPQVLKNMKKHYNHYKASFRDCWFFSWSTELPYWNVCSVFYLIIYTQQSLIEHLLYERLWDKHWRYEHSALSITHFIKGSPTWFPKVLKRIMCYLVMYVQSMEEHKGKNVHFYLIGCGEEEERLHRKRFWIRLYILWRERLICLICHCSPRNLAEGSRTKELRHTICP